MGDRSSRKQRRHDRRLTDAQRDERVKLDMDPEDAVRILLGVEPSDDDEKKPESRP